MSARRYTDGKLKYQLISDTFLKELARVYTIGAEKYTVRDDEGNILDDGADNWRKGMSWRTALGAVKRHIAKFEAGEDYDTDFPKELLDKYGPTYHLANAVWGLATILDFYKTHPECDDRLHTYLKPKKIGLDIDGVLADLNNYVYTYLDLKPVAPTTWSDPSFIEVFNKVKNIDDFWLTLPTLNKSEDIPFEPHCYITSRSIDKDITKIWLNLNGFADKPVISVGHGESKVQACKDMNIDYFIDDSYDNFTELNSNGICTFLYDSPHNKKYDVGYKRILNFEDFKNRFL